MNLSDKRFQNSEDARKWFEAQRWPHGPWCPHCGNIDPDRITKLEGEKHRPGVYQCNEPECREQFTVTVGTVMEHSKIPLHKWLLAMHLMASSKKGMSAHQLHRMLGITYQSAWFLAHRIREAMRETDLPPLGGSGKIVEADETYHGKRETPRKRNKYSPPPTKGGKSGGAEKRIVLGLVERGAKARMIHIQQATIEQVWEHVATNVRRESRLHTDENKIYTSMGKQFAAHETVHHTAGEYVRGDVHTNTAENLFSVFKRGMYGIYQHCGEAHLHRYLAEFEFRYNHRSKLGIDDEARAEDVARGIEGKRLTYRSPDKATNQSPASP